MNIYEYQSKKIFKDYNIPIPNGNIASTPDEAYKIANNINSDKFIVKAQIYSGSRAKAGGVKIANSQLETKQIAQQLLNTTLSTVQTSGDYETINIVYIEEAINIDHELYLAVTLDRSISSLTIIASKEGGVDIEEVATISPNKILTIPLNDIYIWPFQIRKLLYEYNLNSTFSKELKFIIKSIVNIIYEKDAYMIEINPLAVSGNKLIAIDSKINFDDNAINRHDDIKILMSNDKIRDIGINYIKMKNGNIGTMVNGAGLAMATMDLIEMSGGSPANFLDVGGAATEDMIKKGFETIILNRNVSAIFVNIFGGILRCDILASGIVSAAKQINIKVPLIIRLEGTNVDQGKRILLDSDLSFYVANSLSDASQKIMSIVRKI